MQIKSKFSGRCSKCSGFIGKGETCEWERGVGVSHTVCPPPETNGNGNGSVAVTMGVFRKDGRIYVVKPNKEKTRFYAKEIIESPARITEAGTQVDFESVYRPGVIYNLQETDRWPLAEAANFLTRYARCIVCGRHLKAAKSVATSIGPVCSKYFG